MKILGSLDRYIKGNTSYKSAAIDGLSAFYTDTDDSPPTLLQNSKDQILTDFLHAFKQAQGASMDPRIKSMNKAQLKALLSEWNSVDKQGIGAMLSDEMATELQKNILTGRDIGKDIEAIRTSEGADVEGPASIGAEVVQKELDKVKNILGGYIDILQNGQDNLLLMKIVSLYQEAGGKISDTDLAKYNGLTLTNTDTALNIGKVSKALDDLANRISELQGMSLSEPISSFSKITSSIKKDFNQIGSEGIHESLGAHSANVVGKRINDMLEPILPSNLFKGSSWTIISESNMAGNTGLAGTKMSGKQQKDDIIITWTDGTYTINLPVTMKARYSAANYNPKMSRNIFGTLTPQSINLGELIDMNYSSKTPLEKAWNTWLSGKEGAYTSYIGADKDSKYPNLVSNWEDFKEAAKYTALFRGLVGTGVNKDFSALLIVNSTIFSVYDILEQADTPKIIRWSGYTGPPPSFIEIANSVTGNYSKGNWPEDIHDTTKHQEIINRWYSKKYAIEIQLSNLSAILR